MKPLDILVIDGGSDIADAIGAAIRSLAVTDCRRGPFELDMLPEIFEQARRNPEFEP